MEAGEDRELGIELPGSESSPLLNAPDGPASASRCLSKPMRIAIAVVALAGGAIAALAGAGLVRSLPESFLEMVVSLSEEFFNLLREHKLHLLGGLAALAFLIALSLLGACQSTRNLSTLLKEAVGRMKSFVLLLALAIGLFYLDVGSDIVCLMAFLASRKLQYFTINVAAIIGAALWGAVDAMREVQDEAIQPYYGMPGGFVLLMTFFQMLPLSVLMTGLVLLVRSPRDEYFERVSKLGRLLATAGLNEAMVESLTSGQTQLYSAVHEEDLKDLRTTLLGSVLLGALSLAKAFSEIDKQGKVTRTVAGVPVVVGTAPMVSVPFFAVCGCRLCSLGASLLAPTLFQHITAGWLVFRDINVGAFALLAPALAGQVVLVWVSTRNWRKLPFAFANLFSPVEPLLHSGWAIFTTPPVLSMAINTAITVAMAAAVVAKGGMQRILEILDSLQATLLRIWAVCFIGQWLLLAAIRCYVYMTCKPDRLLGSDFPQFGDIADQQVPYTRLIPPCLDAYGLATYEEVRFDLPRDEVLAMIVGAGLKSDVGAQALGEALKSNGALGALYLNNAQVGDKGAQALGEALKSNGALEELSLSNTQVGDKGAQALGEVCKDRGINLDLVYSPQDL